MHTQVNFLHYVQPFQFWSFYTTVVNFTIEFSGSTALSTCGI